jgi:hypothetical protein
MIVAFVFFKIFFSMIYDLIFKFCIIILYEKLKFAKKWLDFDKTFCLLKKRWFNILSFIYLWTRLYHKYKKMAIEVYI